MVAIVLLAFVVGVARPRLAPHLILLFVVLFEQELYAGNTDGSVGFLVGLGQDLYYSRVLGNLPASAIICALLILVGITAFRNQSGALLKSLCLILIVWIFGLSLYQGNSIESSLTAIFRPAAIWAGVLIGSAVMPGNGDALLRRTLYYAVAAKAAIGVFAFALGQGAPSEIGLTLAFYDSAPLVIAGGTLVAAVAERELSGRARLVGAAGAVALAAVSLRRASLAGVVLLIVLIALVGRRLGVLVVAALLSAVAIGAFAILDPRAVSAVFDSIAQASSGFTGGGQVDSSTAGHLEDNVVGLELARQHPIMGVGVMAGPQDDFVVNQGNLLYVHNEFLFAWLHYGIVGLIILLAIVIVATISSLRTFWRIRSGATSALFGAAVVVACLPGMWFFPHLLTLERFSLLFGLCAGLAGSRRVTADRPRVGPRKAIPQGDPKSVRWRRAGDPGRAVIVEAGVR